MLRFWRRRSRYKSGTIKSDNTSHFQPNSKTFSIDGHEVRVETDQEYNSTFLTMSELHRDDASLVGGSVHIFMHSKSGSQTSLSVTRAIDSSGRAGLVLKVCGKWSVASEQITTAGHTYFFLAEHPPQEQKQTSSPSSA